jgi:hypothetical protein
VNEKYLKPHTISNYAHFLAFSNDLGALHLDDADRRWAVPGVTEDPRNKAYWDEFYAWWQNRDGLGIILAWLLKRAENPANIVGTGERAPTSAAKKEMIAESMSDGARIAFDFGEVVVGMNAPEKDRPEKELKKVLLAVDDVRDWVASRLQISKNDRDLDKPRVIRRALVRAGLQEPRLARGETRTRRFLVAADRKAMSYVVANFEIEAGAEWKDLKEFYKVPDAIRVPM